jgi:predicted small secreted protein
MNKAIFAVVALILLALAIRACQGVDGYISEVQQAAQQRSAAYAGVVK